MPKGIYQELHKSERSRVLIKRVKNRAWNINNSTHYYKFATNHKIYLLIENQVYKVGKKKDLMNALGNSTNVKKYIKSNRLRFENKTLETSLGRVMKYYDEL